MKFLIRIFFLFFLTAFNSAFALVCESTPSATLEDPLREVSANPLAFEFETGARWELCWHVDDQSGLVLSQIHYGAPRTALKKVLDSASIAQIIFQYDEDTEASHLLSEQGLGGNNWDENTQNCKNGEWISGAQHRICQQRREINILARARNYRSLLRNEITLQALSTIGVNQFKQLWQFTEDGEFKPSLVYSGKISRYTDNSDFGVNVDDSGRFASSATLLVNWRLDFNIDDSPNNDRVDEFNFISNLPDDLSREISITPITQESFRKTSNTDFRGWRISDQDATSGNNGDESPTRIGYYLDPQPTGYRLLNPSHEWTEFDFAVTNRQGCEKLASGNNQNTQNCGSNLSDFVNDELLDNPVVWFSLTRHFTPSKEDFPAIRSKRIGFSLIPFDWTAFSPFSAFATPIINPSLPAQ